MAQKNRINADQIVEKKKNGQKIVMLTAYDYPMACVLDQAGIDIILVGDSLANVVLGLELTREVGMDEMIHHAKAVNRAVNGSMLVGDMPFGSYEKDFQSAVANAGRFVEEAGCDAVKLEWFDGCPSVSEAIIQSGIPVMGHVGLTPQAVTDKAGFRVQGKSADSAKEIIRHAKELEKVGCFSVVLECVPSEVARVITEEIQIPTIGIGAGACCDGQVLVTHDLLGFFDRYKPKFVKKYVDLNAYILKAVNSYRDEVKNGKFPAKEHSFAMPKDEINKLR